jgi:hypothetical protein
VHNGALTLRREGYDRLIYGSLSRLEIQVPELNEHIQTLG